MILSTEQSVEQLKLEHMGKNVKIMQPLWKTGWKFLKKFSIHGPFHPYLFTEKKWACPFKHSYMAIHNNFFGNRQKVEAAQMFIHHGWINIV
jgi:hypothetical protein